MSGPSLFFSQLRIVRLTSIWIGTLTVVVTATMEVALFTTEHDVKVVIAYFFNVLSISVGCNTILISLGYTYPTIIVRAICIFRSNIVLLAFSVLPTIAGMENQIFETVNLIIYLKITGKVVSSSFCILQIQQSYRILRSIGIIGILPLRIEILGSLRILIVSTKEGSTFVALIKINRQCRIHAKSCTNSTTRIGIAVFFIHILRINLHIQMVVEERGRQVQTYVGTTHP